MERTNDESDKNQKSVLGWFSWKKNYSSLDTSHLVSSDSLFFEVSRWDKEIFRSSLLPIPGEVLNYTLFIEFVFISSEKGIPRWTSVEREANAIRIVGFNRWKNKRWKKKEVSRRRQDELSWKKTSREDSIISRMGGGHRDRKKSTPATICISTAPTCDRINNVGAKQKKLKCNQERQRSWSSRVGC